MANRDNLEFRLGLACDMSGNWLLCRQDQPGFGRGRYDRSKRLQKLGRGHNTLKSWRKPAESEEGRGPIMTREVDELIFNSKVSEESIGWLHVA